MALVSLPAYLKHWVQRKPDSAALIYADSPLSWRGLGAKVLATAAYLRDQGVERGDRVAILANNSPYQFLLLHACARLGAMVLPINWRLAQPEIAHILADAQPRLLFCEECFADKLSDQPSLYAHDVGVLKQLRPSIDALDAPEVDLQAPVLLLYTSGTTGAAKGVMLSQSNLLLTARMATEYWCFDEASYNLVAMPLFHIGGLGYGLMAFFSGGVTVILETPDPQAIGRAFSLYPITNAFFVPAVIQSLLTQGILDTHNTHSLRLLAYGAAPMPEAPLYQAMQQWGCGFAHAYGLTESAGTVITLLPSDHEADGDASRLLSCGKPVDWVELAIVNPDNGQRLPSGEVGELWLKSPMVTSGYWQKPEMTAQAFSELEWFRTGDAAYQDDDGYVFLKDRFKDMIISGGENIYPAEVENALMFMPEVAEVAVVGGPHPRWGETPIAFVVKNKSDVDESAVIAFAREQLAHYKCPTQVNFVQALPRNASGKVLKHVLRQQVSQ